MQFSLIVATINRVDTLPRLLESLANQNCTDFEVVIADQNKDDRLGPVVAGYMHRLGITRLRSRGGLSAARNDGLAAATGEYAAFPDDDCWYLPHTLDRVGAWLAEHPTAGGVSAACSDASGRLSVQDWPRRPGPMASHNVWRRAVSIGIFIRRAEIIKVGGFDESLGAGCAGPWGSGEETDLLLRLLAAGTEVFYRPESLVGHANPTAQYDAAACARALAYGRGLGRVLAKHHRPLHERATVLTRPMLGAVRAALLGRSDQSRFYLQSLKGRWQGLCGITENNNFR